MQEARVQRIVLPALLAILFIGTFVIVRSSGGDDGGTARATATTATATTARSSGRRTVRVRRGDNPTRIADRAGIPLSRLLELNPRLDARTLRPGQTLRIAR